MIHPGGVIHPVKITGDRNLNKKPGGDRTWLDLVIYIFIRLPNHHHHHHIDIDQGFDLHRLLF